MVAGSLAKACNKQTKQTNDRPQRVRGEKGLGLVGVPENLIYDDREIPATTPEPALFDPDEVSS